MDNLVQDRLALLDPPQHWRPAKRRRPRRGLQLAVATAGVCVVLLGASAGWAQLTAPSAPYVFECEQLQINHAKNGQPQRRWIRIRADGVHEWSQAPPTPWLWFLVHTTVMHPDGAVDVYAGPLPLPKFLLHGRMGRPPYTSECATPRERIAGREQVFERETVIVDFTDGSYRFRSWRAPALGCEQLRATATLTLPDGTTKLVWEQRPVKVWP